MMPGVWPALRRRRLAPVPCSLRGNAITFMLKLQCMRNVCAAESIPRDQGIQKPLSCDEGENCSIKYQSANSDITESPFVMRLKVSASNSAQVSCRILLHALAAADSGIVSVTTSSSSGDEAMRSIAAPDST